MLTRVAKDGVQHGEVLGAEHVPVAPARVAAAQADASMLNRLGLEGLQEMAAQDDFR